MTQINKKLVRFFTTSCFCLAVTNEALALESEVKIGGLYDFTSLYYKNNGKPEQQVVSQRQKDFGFDSTGNIFVDYQLINDYNHKYGAKLNLEHTSANDRAVPFFVYHESEIGRIELGADSSAGKKMRITGYSASAATGGGWTPYLVTTPNDPNDPKQKLVPYITNFCSFLDSKARTSKKVDYPRKITYFTPKLDLTNKDHQVQFGVSYVPDSSNTGFGNIGDDNKTMPLVSVPYKFVVRDGVSYGAVYSGKYTDDLSGKLSFVGERGKGIAYDNKTDQRSNETFKRLNTYVVGAEVKYRSFGFSASYANYNESLTSKRIDVLGTKTDVYGFGVKYSLDKYVFAINQFNSNHKKNKLSASSIGAEYLPAKGLKLYGQLTGYETNGRYILAGNLKKDKMKGILITMGSKIAF